MDFTLDHVGFTLISPYYYVFCCGWGVEGPLRGKQESDGGGEDVGAATCRHRSGLCCRNRSKPGVLLVRLVSSIGSNTVTIVIYSNETHISHLFSFATLHLHRFSIDLPLLHGKRAEKTSPPPPKAE